VAGGAGANPIEMGNPRIERVTLENAPGLLVDVAYKVTTPAFGGEAGAVYSVTYPEPLVA
jgi:hypothetical protein